MKTLLITILIGLAPAFLMAQTPNAKKCALIYSEDEEALVYKDPTTQNSDEILIESLPGSAGEPVPLYIDPSAQGEFTFKKHPSLSLPEYYSVIIKDTVTGESFDLKVSDSYTFNVNKITPDRFVLCIDKKKTRLTAMR